MIEITRDQADQRHSSATLLLTHSQSFLESLRSHCNSHRNASAKNCAMCTLSNRGEFRGTIS